MTEGTEHVEGTGSRENPMRVVAASDQPWDNDYIKKYAHITTWDSGEIPKFSKGSLVSAMRMRRKLTAHHKPAQRPLGTASCA